MTQCDSRLISASRPLPWFLIGLADLMVAASAPVAALAIRRGQFDALDSYVSYWGASILCSCLCFYLFGISRGISRYFSWRDVPPIATSVITSVGAASLLSFSIDRMASVSRTEPILHAALLFLGLCGARLVCRHAERLKGRNGLRDQSSVQQALLIGTSPMAEVYLRMVEEMASLSHAPTDVVGVIAEKSRHVGRTIRGREVLGTLSDLEAVLTKLKVHGVTINTVVIAAAERFLSEGVKSSLSALEASGTKLIRLADVMGCQSGQGLEPVDVVAASVPGELGTWPGKRLLDVAVALVLLVVLFPVLVCLVLGIMLDVGRPVVFWQIRPGFRGVPTRFYKFRTMSNRVRGGEILPDELRISWFGRLVRRTRLDEVPQLINILLGQMSIIGPRPLLPRDLHADGAERVRMRPGVTGWAQVNGGKYLSSRDKMALDLWYAHHASLSLDLLIGLRTLVTIVRGDCLNHDAIERAYIFLEFGSERLSWRGDRNLARA